MISQLQSLRSVILEGDYERLIRKGMVGIGLF